MARCAGFPALSSRLLRMLAVARVELLHLTHDMTSISLILIIPAVQIVLFGYALNLAPKNIPIAISRGHDGATDQVRKTVEETGYFVIEADRLPPGGAREMVVRGKALVGIEVPRADGFSSDQASVDPTIIVDASDPATIRPALTALENAYLRHVAEIFAIGPVPEAKVVYLFNPMSEIAWAIVPGLVGVVVMITMLVLGALTLVRERERGSWEALLATPVDAIDALAGKLSPYVLVGIVQAAVVIWIAHLLFNLPLDGDVTALLLAVPLYSAAHLVLGFVFSALAENQLQAVQGAVFFYLPSMLLSGFLFPFQGMPAWARSIGEALPLTHFLRATRDVLIRGEGAPSVIAEMKPVAIFSLVAAALALVAYRRRVD